MGYSLATRWEKVGNFIGTYNRSLDEKGRLQLPPKLVGEAEGPYYVLRGFEGCLSVYPATAFGKLIDKLSALDYFDSGARRFVRLAVSSAERLDVDAHGRISIRREIAEKMNLRGEVLLLGALDHFEIWDPQAYEAYLQGGESYEDLGNSLSGRE